MKEISQYELTVKKSKFFAHLFSIKSLEELKEVLSFMENKYNKSTHICYGAIIQKKEFFKNDSEVGNPGKILIKILKNNNFNDKILIIARNYGRIKLRPSGVGRAFKEAGQACL